MKYKLILAFLSLYTIFAPVGVYAFTEEEITSNLNCPDQGGCTMIVVDCECPSGVKIKEEVRAMMADGYSERKIYDALVKEYGRGVLATPPKEGFDWIVWVALPLGVSVGGIVIWKISKKKMDENELFEYEYNKYLNEKEQEKL